MQTFAKLALAAGACALGLGAVAPVQAADMGYPEAQAHRLPGAAARLLRAAAGPAGLLSTASAARRVWLSAASARRIRHLRRAALRRGAGTVLRAGAVLARLRTALCLWLWALARLSALVRARERRAAIARCVMPALVPGIHVGFAAKQKTWTAGTSPAMTREEHLRIFSLQFSVRFSWLKRTTACFTANISRQTNWISET